MTPLHTRLSELSTDAARVARNAGTMWTSDVAAELNALAGKMSEIAVLVQKLQRFADEVVANAKETNAELDAIADSIRAGQSAGNVVRLPVMGRVS